MTAADEANKGTFGTKPTPFSSRVESLSVVEKNRLLCLLLNGPRPSGDIINNAIAEWEVMSAGGFRNAIYASFKKVNAFSSQDGESTSSSSTSASNKKRKSAATNETGPARKLGKKAKVESEDEANDDDAEVV